MQLNLIIVAAPMRRRRPHESRSDCRVTRCNDYAANIAIHTAIGRSLLIILVLLQDESPEAGTPGPRFRTAASRLSGAAAWSVQRLPVTRR
jgi:hypothetical protein